MLDYFPDLSLTTGIVLVCVVVLIIVAFTRRKNTREVEMLTPVEWAALAATISAMADVIQFGERTFDRYFRARRDSPENARKVEALQQAFGTYSDAEIEAIRRRVEACRERFIGEGSGEARKKCLCSVLRDVRDGNGGTIPDEEWSRYYDVLGCETI